MEGYANSTGGASYRGGENAVKATTASSAVEDFDPAIQRLEQLAQRASVCADRVSGSRPSPVGTGDKERESGDHLIYSIQRRRERLVRAIDFLESEMKRIEGGLG